MNSNEAQDRNSPGKLLWRHHESGNLQQYFAEYFCADNDSFLLVWHPFGKKEELLFEHGYLHLRSEHRNKNKATKRFGSDS